MLNQSQSVGREAMAGCQLQAAASVRASWEQEKCESWSAARLPCPTQEVSAARRSPA